MITKPNATPTRKQVAKPSDVFETGMMPPQAPDLEKAILGAIMLEDKSIFQVADKLKPEMFYLHPHREIYESCLSLYLSQRPIDILTVTEHLKQRGRLDTVGGVHAVVSLTSKVSTSANLVHHALIVIEKYMLRELIQLSSELTRNSYSDQSDVFELMEFAFTRLYTLHNLVLGMGGTLSWQDILHKALQDIEARGNSENGISGISTGNRKLDKLTGGWEPGQLIVIAARPAMGKTARLLNFLKQAAREGKQVMMFSLEMEATELAKRMISEEGQVPGDFLKSGRLSDADWERVTLAAQTLVNLGITLVDKPFMGCNEIQTMARMKKVRSGLDLIAIDYLQLMKTADARGKTRDQLLGEITSTLKQVAKELKVPILLLSQLSREVEKRADKRPQLSDLRESGSIENDADLVMALYRPSYYHDQQSCPDDFFANMSPEEYEAASEIIILKQRGGDSGISVHEKFFGKYSRFGEEMEWE